MAETMLKRDMTFACGSILVQVCGSLLKILGVKQRLRPQSVIPVESHWKMR